MTSKGIITSAQEAIVAAGKSATEGAKALAGEVGGSELKMTDIGIDLPD